MNRKSVFANLSQRKESILIGIELLEELLPLLLVVVGALERELRVDLFPVNVGHLGFLGFGCLKCPKYCLT